MIVRCAQGRNFDNVVWVQQKKKKKSKRKSYIRVKLKVI